MVLLDAAVVVLVLVVAVVVTLLRQSMQTAVTLLQVLHNIQSVLVVETDVVVVDDVMVEQVADSVVA